MADEIVHRPETVVRAACLAAEQRVGAVRGEVVTSGVRVADTDAMSSSASRYGVAWPVPATVMR
jgi:hypothetical protein